LFGETWIGIERRVLAARAKSNIAMVEPALASTEPPPSRSPRSQLSSINRTTEAYETWS
jgi:hypothetical protein